MGSEGCEGVRAGGGGRGVRWVREGNIAQTWFGQKCLHSRGSEICLISLYAAEPRSYYLRLRGISNPFHLSMQSTLIMK